jgi:hypothetical protein
MNAKRNVVDLEVVDFQVSKLMAMMQTASRFKEYHLPWM